MRLPIGLEPIIVVNGADVRREVIAAMNRLGEFPESPQDAEEEEG